MAKCMVKSLVRWHAIGIEIEERHCETAARRMAQGVLDFGTANAGGQP